MAKIKRNTPLYSQPRLYLTIGLLTGYPAYAGKNRFYDGEGGNIRQVIHNLQDIRTVSEKTGFVMVRDVTLVR